MFKKAVSKYFSWSFIKRILIFAIFIAIMIVIYGLFVLDLIQVWFPKQEIYSYFDQIATDVVKLKSTDFLRHLDDLEYLKNLEGLEDSEVSEIYENSNFLTYYSVTEDSLEDTIIVRLSGCHSEELTLTISRDYKLIALDKFCNHTSELWWIALVMILAFYSVGVIISAVLNLIFTIFKKIVEYCSRNKQCEQDEKHEKLEEDEDYSSADYDT